MEPSIFRFVFRYSLRQQIALLCMTLAAFPFLYLSLDLPKTIINGAIGSSDFPKVLLGQELSQIGYLLVLCFAFLGLVLLNGSFKYVINVYRGVVGERMLRRLRYQLFERVLRFPLPQFRRTSQGELVSMITAETEPLGGFIGDSVALPAFQGGTAITILVFMFVQDWKLGLAAVSLYPLQAWLIPKLQAHVNRLKKERIIKVRSLSESIGETVAGAVELHTHDTARYELAGFSERMREIYRIRYEIYVRKFIIKFVNNFLAQVTPFFFYSIGGYLVIKGDLSFGALVAVLAAYKDLSDPWKELLKFYQVKEEARVKYELLVDMFDVPGMLDERRLTEEPERDAELAGALVMSNVDLTEDDESPATFDGRLSLRLELPRHVALLGDASSGRERVAAVLAGVKEPEAGTVTLAGVDLVAAPRAVTGRQFALVTQSAALRSGTVRDNLLYGLKHRPTADADYDEAAAKRRASSRQEAERAGNSVDDLNAEWVDYQAAGVADADGLAARIAEVLAVADVDDDVYHLGLQGTIDPERHGELAERVLEARAELRSRLEAPEQASLVEPFDRTHYNTNMTVAENLLFGTPMNAEFDLDNLPANAYVRKVLQETGLMGEFLVIGRRVAELMVDLFADVAPDSELFERFSFISSDDLPVFRALLASTTESGLEALPEADRLRLLSLPFRLNVARHRLGLIDDGLRARLLEAREVFARGFGDGSPAVEFFDRGRYNASVSIQDNILFGRLRYGRARGSIQIGALIGDVIEKLGLKAGILAVGLEFSVGVGGSRLTPAQRQKIAIARAVLKRPQVLLVDQATAVLDGASQQRVMRALRSEFRGRTLIWLLHRASLAEEFDETLVMENGRVVLQGAFAELRKSAEFADSVE